MAVAAALTVAVVATFAIGAHHNMPSRLIKKTWTFPSVTSSALESGCAAWSESVESCLATQAETGGESAWPDDERPQIKWPER